MKPASLAKLLNSTVAAGNRIWVFGNGGSFANASHFAADLSSKYRAGGLMWPAFALGANQSLLTANSNDNEFENAIALELRALAYAGDFLLVISTSGRSPNVLKALKEAERRGVTACLLTSRHSAYERVGGIRTIRAGTGLAADVELTHAQYLSSVVQIVSAARFDSDNRAKAIFLDRDGTLIPESINGKQLDPERILPGIPRLLRTLRGRGYLLILISNQSIVGHGKLSLKAHWQIHQRFANALRAEGAWLNDYYYCLHARDAGCICRKPRPGSLMQASQDWSIDLPSSYVIGNQESDVGAANSVGCRHVLLQFEDGKQVWKSGYSPSDALARFSNND
jgi:histidinol-phosphate phosphatase family protein